MDVIRLFGGGFPLTIERLQFLQNTYTKAFSQLSKVVGSGNMIIDGVVVSGSNVSAGVVIIDGEILEFEGGAYNDRVGIFETVVQVPYNEDADNDGNLDLKDADVVRVARCAATGGVSSFQFSTLARVANMRAISPQVGDMKMIYRTYDPAIDAGWLVCDGTNGTPDFRDRFPVGAGNSYDIGDVGGLEAVTISRAQLPNFNMTGTTGSAGRHNHTVNTPARDNESVDNGGGRVVQDNHDVDAVTSFAPDHTHSVSINSGGSNQPHENRPPYRAVNMLIYVGF